MPMPELTEESEPKKEKGIKWGRDAKFLIEICGSDFFIFFSYF